MSSVHKPILILMGPTASGKSAMGISLAKKCGGVIINADAMQCYADLRIITARPSDAEMSEAPHALYGVWGARTMGNAAMWQEEAVTAIHAAHAAGQVPILLGGTGMYIKGLTEGLSSVPAISHAVKEEVASADDLYVSLKKHDPRMAEKLEANDHQRIARALEVVLETGRSLLDWQAEQAPAPFSEAQCHFAYIDIPRETVYGRINDRFEAMIEQGALEEVAAMKAQFSPEEIAAQRYPILKSHGVPELMAHLDGQMSLQDAMAKGQQNTRNYAKRQMTWIRGQAKGAHALAWDGGEEALRAWLNPLPFASISA